MNRWAIVSRPLNADWSNSFLFGRFFGALVVVVGFDRQSDSISRIQEELIAHPMSPRP